MVAGPAGRLLQPADPDGGGRARARGAEAGRRSTRAARRSSASTSTSSSAAGATTPGARPRPARTSSTRSRDLCEPGGGKPRSLDLLYRGSVPADRGARARPTAGARRPATRRRPARRRCSAERTKLGLVAGRGTVHGKPVIVHQAALDLLPRGRLRGRLHGLQRRRRTCATPRPSSARRARSATRSTGSTPTRSTSPTSTPAPTRCARKRVDHDFPVRGARYEWQGWNPDTWHGELHARSRSTRRRSTSSTWSPGTTSRRAASRGRTRTSTRRRTARVLLEDRAQGAASRGGRKLTLPEGDRRDGGGRHAATCARTSICRWR